MDSKKIKELIKLVNESDIAGLTVEDGDFKVEIRKDSGVPVVLNNAPVRTARPKEPAKDTTGLVAFKAPMPGTFYSSTSPTDKPFAVEGERVKKGQTVCIIEAMKTFNEIEIDCDGTIEKILVSTAQLVELGQPLFLLRP